MATWWVTDNTVRTLIRRRLATVTHVRKEGRPAAIKIVKPYISSSIGTSSTDHRMPCDPSKEPIGSETPASA